MDVLIPQVTVERLVPGKHVSPEDQALAYFSFFDNYPSGGVDDLPELTEIVRFYNRYYWFGLFAKLRRATVGFDAGIEQQGVSAPRSRTRWRRLGPRREDRQTNCS